MSGALWPALLPARRWDEDELCAVSAHGTRITFADGTSLLCGTSGLWNVNLGYGNDAIAQASAAALHDASYLSVFRYSNGYARRAAQALLDATGARFDRVLFATSGGAANDLTMKLCRQWCALRGQPSRKVVVGLRGSYHGLTFGGFALTGEDLGQAVYGVDTRLVRHVSPTDPGELRLLLQRSAGAVAAVVVEPILGTGTVELTAEFLAELFELRRRHGFLLVADEVATGFGRTGEMFASLGWDEPPDVMIVSKGLTNGAAAASAVLVAAHVAAEFRRPEVLFSHAETQAGTPVSCAAILATLAEFDRLDALARGRDVARRLAAALDELVARHPMVTGLSGRGLFRSVHLAGPDGGALPGALVGDVVAGIRRAGAVVHPGLDGVQLIPALTYTPDDVALLVGAVERGIDAAADCWSALPTGRVA